MHLDEFVAAAEDERDTKGATSIKQRFEPAAV